MMNMQGSAMMQSQSGMMNMNMGPGGVVPSGDGLPPPSSMLNMMGPRRSRPEDAAMHITVSDPVQHADGLNKYTSYRVDVRPPLGSGDEILASNIPISAVLRRYSDFLWLYERLQADRAGAVVPPLPEKQPVGRFSPTFVEERRRHLEQFLRRVAVHPEVSDCSCLDTFLRADDMTFQAVKQIKSASVNLNNMSMSSASYMQQPQMMSQSQYGSGGMPGMMQPQAPPKKEGLKRWFAEAKTSMTGDLVKSPDDDLFDEIARYIHGLDSQMRNVSHQASGLVRKGKEIANGLFEFGLAFNLLGQSEADALGVALGSMGETADKLSVLAAEQAEKEMAQFEEPLQDYLKTIHAVKLALQRRHEKRLTYSTALHEVDSKQQTLNKLRSQIGSEAKAYSTEMSLRRAQEVADLARDDFCACSQRVLREVDRFKREKAEDMRRTVLDYINIQVEYNKRMEEIWAALIPELEKVVPPMEQQQSRPAAPTPVSPDSSQMQQNPYPQQQQQFQNPMMGSSMMMSNSQMLPPQQQMNYGMHPQQIQPQQQPPPPPMGGNGMISVQYRE